MLECNAANHIKSKAPDPNKVIDISKEIWDMSKYISEKAALAAVVAADNSSNLNALMCLVADIRNVCKQIDERSAVLRMYVEGKGTEADDGR